jgi:hypothetical protein
MNNTSNPIEAISFIDFESLPNSAIILSPDDIDQALDILDKVPNELKQWQVYLNSLALSAFKDWLSERGMATNLSQEKCTILQPPLASVIEVVTNLQVGDFKVCLIATGNLADETVTLPRVVIDLPEYIPHFYVVVEVLEEQEAANIYAFLSYQEAIERCRSSQLQPDSHWNYHFSMSWFDDNPDNLLLYLRCLEPDAIALPVIPTNRRAIISNLESELAKLLPQLQSPERELWEILTWEQAIAVLTSPDLLNWIYNSQTHAFPEVKPQLSVSYLPDLLKLIAQPVLNVGRWLWNELDEVARDFSWVLLPSLTPASEMRSPVEEFEIIVAQLRDRKEEIPLESRAAFKDIAIAGVPLRLYAVTWHLMSDSEKPEWVLLVILGAPALGSLPHHVKLRISDQNHILVERGLEAGSNNSYIFTRVVGNWDEKFLVSVSLMDGVEVTLPPFAFDLGR